MQQLLADIGIDAFLLQHLAQANVPQASAALVQQGFGRAAVVEPALGLQFVQHGGNLLVLLCQFRSMVFAGLCIG